LADLFLFHRGRGFHGDCGAITGPANGPLPPAPPGVP
jgi:hypothetical protein